MTQPTENFNVFMQSQMRMVQGPSVLMLSEHADLESTATALEEQRNSLSTILSEMSKEDLADIKSALEESVKGFLTAGQSFKSISKIGKIMSEGLDPELPKLGFSIGKVEESYETIGRVLKSFLESVKEAAKTQS